MCLEKRRGSPFIGEKEAGNPTSNRCGIPYFSKSNNPPPLQEQKDTFRLEIWLQAKKRKKKELIEEDEV